MGPDPVTLKTQTWHSLPVNRLVFFYRKGLFWPPTEKVFLWLVTQSSHFGEEMCDNALGGKLGLI